MSGNSSRLELKLSVPVVILVVLVSGGLILGFFLASSEVRSTIIFVSATAAAAGTVLAAHYSARVLELQIQQNEKAEEEKVSALALRRRENAMKFGARWNDPNMLKARQTCREIAGLKGRGLEDIKELLDDRAKRDDVIHVLNFFEEIAASVQQGVTDGPVLKDLFEGTLTKVWKPLALWIEDYRKTVGHPKAWVLTAGLVKNWGLW